MKRIKYLLLAFVFSFLCFSCNVKALVSYGTAESTAFDFDFLTPLSNIFSDSDLVFLKNYFENYERDLGFCVVIYYSDTDIRFNCYDSFNFSSVSVFAGKYFNFTLSPFGTYVCNYYSNSIDFIDNFNLSCSNTETRTKDLLYRSSNTSKSYLLWTKESLKFPSENVNFVIENDIYESMSTDLKKYYNFKNFFEYDKPLYTLMNLRLGDWSGNRSTVDLVYCIDSLCETEIKKTIEYEYSEDDELIDLSEFLDSDYNGYKLDTSKSYEINANVTKELKVYYYSIQVDYIINYYFDDVLQESLTEKKQGSVNSVITLSNLDKVKDDIYFLDNDEYSITLSAYSDNIIDVYYYSKDVPYSVNVYLDDIYYQSHSYVAIGKVGCEVVLENLKESIGIYSLDAREYKISLTENSEINYLNVYYFSNNYDTKYQDIDTSDKFYISFDWVYIKELFNLKGDFTQTEQFIIVYVVNFLFYAIVCIFGYFGLKMINKLFSLFKMF